MYNRSLLQSVSELPPTSHSLSTHLKRCYYVVHTCASVMWPHHRLNPVEYGWYFDDGVLMPVQYINFIPDRILQYCGCTSGCSNMKCACKRESVICCSVSTCSMTCANTDNK